MTEGYIGGDAGVGCARTRDRRTAIIYLPAKPARQQTDAANPKRPAPIIDVDLTHVKGRAIKIRWYNPDPR